MRGRRRLSSRQSLPASPDLRTQLQEKIVGGNSVTEVLVVVKQPGDGMAVVHFDPQVLQTIQS
jgi:hypothetical protein